MPAIVFTPNSTTDQLTATAHGLLTGDVIRLVSGGGTLPTASGGDLVEATDYFAIRIDANTIKLARSQALALAGTAIDLTGTGSGQHYLLYGLPFIRNRTYAAASQSFSSTATRPRRAPRSSAARKPWLTEWPPRTRKGT